MIDVWAFFRCAVLVLCIAGLSLGQTTRPSTRPQDEATKLLDTLSEKLYTPIRSGLRELSYDYLTTPEGALQGKFRVDVRYRTDSRPTVQFLSDDRSPMKELPAWLNSPAPGKKGTLVKDLFESGGRATLKWFVPETPSRQYETWAKRLESRTVNGRPERILVLEPSSSHPLRRVEMNFDARGLPWRIIYYPQRPAEGGDAITEEPLYESIDGKLVRSSWKEVSGVSSIQHVLTFQLVRGYLLPTSHERLAPGSKQPDRTVFDRVTVIPPLN